MTQNQAERIVRLPVRSVRIATREGTLAETRTVHCPLSIAAREVAPCLKCTRLEREVVHMGKEFLECRVPMDVANPRGVAGELISAEVTCLDADLDASTALALLGASGVTSAPVVDDNSVLVGVVFVSTLSRLREGRGLEVEDAMVTDVVTASQRTTVAEVARLMAQHDLDRVPVVTGDGHLVGVVSAMDLVRWLAEHLD